MLNHTGIDFFSTVFIMFSLEFATSFTLSSAGKPKTKISVTSLIQKNMASYVCEFWAVYCKWFYKCIARLGNAIHG